ncbi:MAG: 16S rRNA (cytosine(1402)-N(4))-methyltransferase RsmH [Candidatus Pacebacteria bacterium]|nr:16S rRNA (cytosine(1402)-N(4))-methyltransferase RsmH [Candidatus Paceibacterota bacterium]
MENHITVLRSEAVTALNVQPDSILVDATFGAGGHTREIVPKLGTGGTLIALDADPIALKDAESSFAIPEGVQLVLGNFRHIDTILADCAIGPVDGILADLGWRMEQFSGNGRGFSFQINEPLMMTYGDPEHYPFTAADIVNDWEEHDIANVIKGYSDERYAKRIAKAIVSAREVGRITHSGQLAEIITGAVPGFYKRGKIHPATRTFQALRIAVNDELDALKEFIEKAVTALAPEGRLAIISFHSIEDRIVKHTFKALARDHAGEVLTKKPITASEKECAINPRSRSAKLRIFKKTNAT